MDTKDLTNEAKVKITEAREIFKRAEDIINSDKITKKEKQKDKWLKEAKEFLAKAKEKTQKADDLINLSKESLKTDKDKAKKYALEARETSREAIKNSKKAIRRKNWIEETTKKWIKANLTLTNISLVLLFLYTIAVILVLEFFAKTIIEFIFEISYKYVGRFEFAQFFGIGFLMLAVSLLAGFVIWSIHFFNKKKVRWWFWITILLMFLIGTTGFLFVHMAIGQDDLQLKLRNQAMVPVGELKCGGSSEVLFVSDNISCKIKPMLSNVSANVSFKVNGTFTEPVNFDNLNFLSIENVEYISFQIEGIENNKLMTLTTGNPYHFYSKEEYNELKTKFVKYLFAILSLIFVTVPLVMYQLRKLHD